MLPATLGQTVPRAAESGEASNLQKSCPDRGSLPPHFLSHSFIAYEGSKCLWPDCSGAVNKQQMAFTVSGPEQKRWLTTGGWSKEILFTRQCLQRKECRMVQAPGTQLGSPRPQEIGTGYYQLRRTASSSESTLAGNSSSNQGTQWAQGDL